jgi:hypothetical protein
LSRLKTFEGLKSFTLQPGAPISAELTNVAVMNRENALVVFMISDRYRRAFSLVEREVTEIIEIDDECFEAINIGATALDLSVFSCSKTLIARWEFAIAARARGRWLS